ISCLTFTPYMYRISLAVQHRYSVKGYTVTTDDIVDSPITSGSPTAAAGFFGIITGGSTIKRLTLLGDVKVVSAPSPYGRIYAGGFVGHIIGTGNIRNTLINCTYAGIGVSATSSISYSTVYSGGFLGYCGSDGEIINCVYSGSGDVSGSMAGGFVGNGASLIENCVYSGSGNVIGTSVAGGIAGSAGYHVRNCVYSGTGNVIASNYAGGILGEHGNGVIIDNCVYSGTGTVTANNGKAGGIVGESYGVSNSITNCAWNKDAASKDVGTEIAPSSKITGVVSLDAEEFAKIVTTVILDDTEVAAGASTEVKFTTFPGKPDNLADYITVTPADTYDQSVATASFENENITVKGLKEGITELLASVEINTYDFANRTISTTIPPTAADLSSMVTVSSAPPIPETPTDPDTPTDPETPPTPDTHKPRSGGSSGCDTGTAAIALLALLPLFYKKKR
ncbi:MAG: SYNERG-CTERM sorting domain-containing protein, partial [Cloacibacillus porcorum]|uniref:Synerg-CTERM sorting domain-containing protein n=1 Tax=Cloacibacillus porcorum TaxID=1197717 RepID=UPI0023F2E0DC